MKPHQHQILFNLGRRLGQEAWLKYVEANEYDPEQFILFNGKPDSILLEDWFYDVYLVNDLDRLEVDPEVSELMRSLSGDEFCDGVLDGFKDYYREAYDNPPSQLLLPDTDGGFEEASDYATDKLFEVDGIETHTRPIAPGENMKINTVIVYTAEDSPFFFVLTLIDYAGYSRNLIRKLNEGDELYRVQFYTNIPEDYYQDIFEEIDVMTMPDESGTLYFYSPESVVVNFKKMLDGLIEYRDDLHARLQHEEPQEDIHPVFIDD